VQNHGQQQFDLGEFSQEPSTDYAEASRYGQQTLPGLSQPPRPKRQKAAPSQGEQLPMLMSQREIMKKYQPLDADRQEAWDPREGEVTGRQFTTIGNENPKIRTSDREAPWLKRQDTAEVAKATHYRDFGQTESLDMMMSRKLEESQMDYGEYAEAHGGGMGTAKTPGYETAAGKTDAPQYEGSGHTGTYDYELGEFHSKLVDRHYEKMSGSLYSDVAHDMTPKEKGGSGAGFTGLVHLSHQFGSAGKPQIAGAHHRLAILGEVAPDRLLPVIHHETMHEARWGEAAKHYPYT
jgi:hypothetical protein